jgi:hypothetical protein
VRDPVARGSSLGLIILNLPTQALVDSPRRRDRQPEAQASGCLSRLMGEAINRMLRDLIAPTEPLLWQLKRVDGSQAANMQTRDLELRYQCLIAYDLSVFEAFYKERSTTTAQGCCGRRLTSTCALPPRFVCNTILCLP